MCGCKGNQLKEKARQHLVIKFKQAMISASEKGTTKAISITGKAALSNIIS